MEQLQVDFKVLLLKNKNTIFNLVIGKMLNSLLRGNYRHNFVVLLIYFIIICMIDLKILIKNLDSP